MSTEQRIAATNDDDDDSNKPTPPHKKIARKENMSDKQIPAGDDSYKPTLRDLIERTKSTYNWDPELLRKSPDEFKDLSYEQQVHWVTTHAFLTRHGELFRDEDKAEYKNIDPLLFT